MVGRTVTLDGQPRTVVGIMPPRFEWHVGDFWIPSPISTVSVDGQPTTKWFQARLRRGVTIEAAEAQMNVIARRRAAAFPADYPEKSRVQVITIIDWVVGRFRQTLYTLFAAVGLLLVIACCNVANMLLARATARERELTLRAALGASRGRIIRQLLIESAVLAAGGTVVGVVLAHGGINALAGVMPRSGVAWEVELRLDQPVLLFALATATLATLAFGLFPAFTSTRRDLVGAINSVGRARLEWSETDAHAQRTRDRRGRAVGDPAPRRGAADADVRLDGRRRSRVRPAQPVRRQRDIPPRPDGIGRRQAAVLCDRPESGRDDTGSPVGVRVEQRAAVRRVPHRAAHPRHRTCR